MILALLFPLFFVQGASVEATGCTIQVKHLGDEDKPMPGMRICLDKKPHAAVDAFLQWTFWFERPTFEAIESFVRKEASRYRRTQVDSESKQPFGTYGVSLSERDGDQKKYVIPPSPASRSCSYFIELRRLGQRGNIAYFQEVVADLLKRLGCSSS